jgi:hypothetical protein
MLHPGLLLNLKSRRLTPNNRTGKLRYDRFGLSFLIQLMLMIKHLLFGLVSLIIGSSCNTVDSTQVDALKQENAYLRSRVGALEDSLYVSSLNLPKITNSKKSKKQTKPSVNSFVSSPNSLTGSTSRRKRSYVSTPSYTHSGQCQALTKKGYQCSRTSRSGGYCWQHGG